MAYGLGYSIGSMLSPYISSGIGAIMSNHSSGKAFGRQLYAMQLQSKLNYDYGQKSLLNSPSSQREGLEKAGYNPMLAVQNSTSGANSGWASPNSVNMDEYAGNVTAQSTNATSFMNARSTMEQTASNIATNQTQQELNKSITSKNVADTTAQNIKNGYLDKREQAEIGETQANTNKLSADTAYTNELKDNIKAEMDLRREIAQLQVSSGITQAGISANATRYSADKGLESTDKLIEHMPSGRSLSFRNYTGGAKDILSGIGSIIHGNTEYYNDTATESHTDKKTGIKTTYKSTRSGRSRKR